jgi:putative transposase
VLKEGEAGVPVQGISRKHGICDQTYNCWKAKYGGLEGSEARGLRSLEEENRRLKQQMVAEQALDMQAVLGKKFWRPRRNGRPWACCRGKGSGVNGEPGRAATPRGEGGVAPHAGRGRVDRDPVGREDPPGLDRAALPRSFGRAPMPAAESWS